MDGEVPNFSPEFAIITNRHSFTLCLEYSNSSGDQFQSWDMGIHFQTFDSAGKRQNPRAASVKAIHRRYVELWFGWVAMICFLNSLVYWLLRFLADSGNIPVGYKLEKGSSVPNITMIKDFILWYMYHTRPTKGRLQPDGRATAKATMVCAERFFSGFVTATVQS